MVMRIKPSRNEEEFVRGAKLEHKESDATTLYLLRLPRDLRVKIKVKAAEAGQSMSDLICEILDRNV
ncbi:MAG TPA: hypothetical protein PKN80_08230 [bacterium]|uniref:Uncharacterized protein n=1 Tax=candidate division TA06 bacterium ADurb.Bin417 TaxID=1852828 RepID=A0A1V5MJW7_UNCT6|nr:MAG: hypothetical protein BWY73_00270 [candidate division TA06 bacterium ADurb.Bin417]HNQ36033.1 hypothetical protein [bacterium]HNS48866.1 hypothetical protein [bacterium]